MSVKKFIPVITYLNPDRDREILTWLESQPNKSAAIRDLLWAHTQERGKSSHPIVEESSITLSTIRQAVADVLAEQLDLATIRQLFEAVLASALAGITVSSASEPVQEEQSEEVLAAFDDNLIWD